MSRSGGGFGILPILFLGWFFFSPSNNNDTEKETTANRLDTISDVADAVEDRLDYISRILEEKANSGGGEVYIPPGTHVVKGVTITGNQISHCGFSVCPHTDTSGILIPTSSIETDSTSAQSIVDEIWGEDEEW